MSTLNKSTGIAAKQRSKPNFTSSAKGGGPYIRVDCKAGKMKLANLPDGDDAFRKSLKFNIDVLALRTAWVEFGPGGANVIQEERDPAPDRAGSKDGPKWTVIADVAAPYPIDVDGIAVESISPHEMRLTAIPALEAISELWEAADQEAPEGTSPVAVVEIERWSKIGNGNNVLWRPHFELLGFVDALDEPLSEG